MINIHAIKVQNVVYGGSALSIATISWKFHYTKRFIYIHERDNHVKYLSDETSSNHYFYEYENS